MEANKLFPALIRAREAIGPIAKTATNPHFKNSYAPLGEVLAAVLPALHAEGLALVAGVGREGDVNHLKVNIVHSESGENTCSYVPLVGASDMQKLGGAMTYAMRYGVGMLLALELEDDDDGQRASQPSARAPESAREHVSPAGVTPASRPAQARSQGKGGGRPAPSAQDDDGDAVMTMAAQLDQDAEDKGEDFRILKADDKLGVFGKVAGSIGVKPGRYSTAQLASYGALPKLREFYAYLCKKNDLPGWPEKESSWPNLGDAL